LPVFSLRLLQKVNGAQCQQLSLAVLLAWLKPSYQHQHLLELKPVTKLGCGAAKPNPVLGPIQRITKSPNRGMGGKPFSSYITSSILAPQPFITPPCSAMHDSE
jgi:hypothetical protein